MKPADAVELIAHAGARIMVSCEHATARLPEPWRWPEEDGWLVDTHWAYDLGAADIARELARHMGAGGVLSRFSRLFVDPNRPPDAPSFIVREVEGRRVLLNAELSDDDRSRRLAYWSAYHDALDDAARDSNAEVLFAVHTFTPDYPGEARDHLDVGILFDAEEELAMALALHLSGAGLRVSLNEPYSGKKGLIYAVDRHAREHGRRALEIEVRQDHAIDPSFRMKLVASLAAFGWV